MIENSLRQIGLTDGEIKVYLALLDLGSSSTWGISRKSGISGSKVYEVLDRLAKKGLISSVVRNGVSYFEAASPDRIINYLEERKKNIEDEKIMIQKIIPDLILRTKNTAKSQVKVFTGWEGLKTASDDILTLRKGEEWLSMGLTQQPESWETYFNHWQEKRAKKGIVHKHLLNGRYKSLYHKRKHLAHTEFRFFSEELEMPTSTEVYGDKVLIYILIQEDPMAILIESKPVAESFKKYFYALWKIAQK